MAERLIPSRMAVDDEDFDPDLGHRLRISVDGVEQESVIAYDVDAGTVTRHRLTEDGSPIIEGEQIATEHVAGIVMVELREG